MAREGLNEIPEETSLPFLLNALCTYTMHTQILPKHLPARNQRLGHYRFQPPLPLSLSHSLSLSSDFFLQSELSPVWKSIPIISIILKVYDISTTQPPTSSNQLPFQESSTCVYSPIPCHQSHTSLTKLTPKLPSCFLYSVFTQPLTPHILFTLP